MALTYAGNWSEVVKRLRRYNGRRFRTAALGPFQYNIWNGNAGRGKCIVIDRTRERVTLDPGVTPTNPFAVAILADLRITTNEPGFATRA